MNDVDVLRLINTVERLTDAVVELVRVDRMIAQEVTYIAETIMINTGQKRP